MKRSFKSMQGVTLLEIMLVLAVAAMVIVMSIRYYQQATNSENTNVILEEIQNIAAAADNLAQGSGSYSTITTSALTAVAGANNLKTPYGTSITFAPVGGTPYSYSVTVNTLPTSVCTALIAKLTANPKFTSPACNGGNLSYTYNSTK